MHYLFFKQSSLWLAALCLVFVLPLAAGCSADQEIAYRDGVYVGRLHNQEEVPHGQGRWTSRNGHIYEGYWSEGEIVEGSIQKEGPDGYYLYYEGQFLNGEKHGEGTLYWEDGNIRYEGAWRKGKMHGQGTLYRQDGSVRYQGEWIDGGF